MTDVTTAEVAATAFSDLFRGSGEILASTIGIVPTIGARLAKLSHSPELLLSDGEATIFADVPAIGEPFTVPESSLTYGQLFELMASGKRHVVMGAAQIDRHGNQNLSAIGPDRAHPSRQLLGARAASSNTANHPTSYWIAKHMPRVFVQRVDIVTGAGTDRARRPGAGGLRFHHLGQVITSLGVLDFSGPDNTMALVSTHPGVTSDRVQEATSFPLHIPAHVPVTRTPTTDELHLIRSRLDPRQLRNREVSS